MKIIPALWPVPFFVAFLASDLMILANLGGDDQWFFAWNRAFAWLFPVLLLAVIGVVRLLINRAMQPR